MGGNPENVLRSHVYARGALIEVIKDSWVFFDIETKGLCGGQQIKVMKGLPRPPRK
jgi:hypothetical protein